MQPRKLILALSAVIQVLALGLLERLVSSDITTVMFADRHGRNRKAQAGQATKSPKRLFKLLRPGVDVLVSIQKY